MFSDALEARTAAGIDDDRGRPALTLPTALSGSSSSRIALAALALLLLVAVSAPAAAAVVSFPAGDGAAAGSCEADDFSLCLLGGRFRVEVGWRNQHAGGETGRGRTVPFTDRSGFFWFFRDDNVELVVKALDGRPVNGSFWFFYGALSDVEYTITLTDTTTAESRTYTNPPGELCGRGDTSAFPLAATAPPTSPARPAPAAARQPPEPAASSGSCTPGPGVLCLLGGRFRVEVDWRDQRAAGNTGRGTAVPFTDKSGFFWFFRDDNVELVVKALDGRPVNGRFWFFYGALSDVEYAITVTDTASGAVRVFHNPPGELCGRGETAAFCDDPAACGPGILFASTPVQARLGDPLLFAFHDMELDADVVSLHQDFYGIPWDAFADGVPPPAGWVARLDEAKALADGWGLPVYLSLSLVSDDGRAYLDARAVATPAGLVVEDAWSERCFDFSSHPDAERWRHAYLAYVRYMVERFDPAFLTHGIEVNLFQQSCDGGGPEAYDALIGVLNEGYAAAKEVKPWLPVFPSLQIDAVTEIGAGRRCFGVDPAPCIHDNLERNAGLLRDRFAISLYPHLIEPAGVSIDYGAYIDGVLDQVPDERPVIAETGYLSVPMTVDVGDATAPECTTVFPYSDARQAAYFEAVLATARSRRMELVTWWSHRDVFPRPAAESCPCVDPNGFCPILELFRGFGAEPWQGEILFKAFATMGVREFDGTAKPLLARWQQVRAEERGRR